MARRMPTAAEYRNAQRVTGMRDVDIADVRDITRRGLKAPAPARKRGKVKSRSRIVTQAKPKATPAQKVAKLKAAKPDSRPTPDEMDVLGRAGQNAPTSNKPLAVKQKVKVDGYGGMSANEAPKLTEENKKTLNRLVNNAKAKQGKTSSPAFKTIPDNRANDTMHEPLHPLNRAEAAALAGGAGASKGAWNAMFGSGGKGGMHNSVIQTGANAGKRRLERVTPQQFFTGKNPSGKGLSGSQATNVKELRKMGRKGFRSGKFGTALTGALLDVILDAKPAY